MSKDAKLRRIEVPGDGLRGSAVGGAVPGAPTVGGSSDNLTIVGQSLGSGKVWLGDAAGLAQEVSPSGDATISNTGVISLANTPTARTNLGLGSMATQAASAVAITGGSVTGITDLAVADGGTGASSAGAARTNLGLGTGDSPEFAGLTIDTDMLVVDATNNRVGFGTASPQYRAHWVGAGVLYNQNAWFVSAVGAPLGWNTTNTTVYIANGYAGAINLEGDGGLRFYTAPSGLAGGAITFAARLQILNTGNMLDQRPVVVVRNSVAQSIAHNTNTTVTFDTDIHDADAFHDTAATTERLTVPTGLGGKYWVWARISVASNATGFRAVTLFKNAATFVDREIQAAVNGERTEISLGSLIDLAAGEYVWCQVYQNSGVALDLDVISSRLPVFGMYRVGT